MMCLLALAVLHNLVNHVARGFLSTPPVGSNVRGTTIRKPTVNDASTGDAAKRRRDAISMPFASTIGTAVGSSRTSKSEEKVESADAGVVGGAPDPRSPSRSTVGRDLYDRLVDSKKGQLNDGDVRWTRAFDMDKYAAELIRAHEGSNELELLYAAQGDALPVGEESKNGAFEHLGAGVFLEKDTPGIDPDSRDDDIDPDSRDDDARTITRAELRTVTREALESFEPARNRRKIASFVVVAGHPGTGKTRGGLTYALQELLWRGEAVLRVGYKDGHAYAFLPNKNGVYEMWRAAVGAWERPEIADHLGAFSLVDPPERGTYVDAAPCNVLKFVSNNAGLHYRNVLNDGVLVLTC